MTKQDQKKVIESGRFYIKPSASHILTIGKGIIKDFYTAILELVKNAYDADAEHVFIEIKLEDGSSKVHITDDGHGMTFDVVTQKWMVPSASDKARQRLSPYKKRTLQGRKGIGRYAASILGSDLFLHTTDKESLITTELLIDWDQFNNESAYLEDIDILIESFASENANPGTKLVIQGKNTWSEKELDELVVALRRLLSPLDEVDKDFKIQLKIEKANSEKYLDYSEDIKPLPILEYYHYRLHGTIKQTENLFGEKDRVVAYLTLENNNLVNSMPAKLEKEIVLSDDAKYCGEITIDIRAFDLDENPILKGGEISIEEAKKQLKELPGIAVIRKGFRVRPYGDKKVDWLSLNERRYNNPTMRLSVNQVAGFVGVQQEDESHLEEKATREGFKEDSYYDGLKQCIIQCLSEIETFRYKYRKLNLKGGRKAKNVTEQISNISNFEKLNSRLTTVLSAAHLPIQVSNQLKLIIEEESKAKEEELNDLQKTIAQYEGQVTLGKIMFVVLHEGRKPLHALGQHPKFIEEWSKEFRQLIKVNYKTLNEELAGLFDKIIDRLNDNKLQAEVFVNIFKKLEPLSNRKRPSKKVFDVSRPLSDAVKLFDFEFRERGIECEISGDVHSTVTGWEVDYFIAFANLIENSIYWTSTKDTKSITIKISNLDERVVIDYQDSGVGIDDTIIETQDIFDPGFSTKPDGTGLGLSIAGEALARNNGKIRAVHSNEGANFIIEIYK